MKMNFRVAALLSATALVAAPIIAYGAGNWSTLPIVGSNSFCGSTVTGIALPSGQGAYGVVPGNTQGSGVGICGQTIPAGPPLLTDEELIPADINASGFGPTQTVAIPSGMVGSLNTHTNKLIGGDFATNLWQRGTTPLSGASPTTATMAADRWWAISASNVVTISKQTPASSAADYLGSSGLYSWMRVARPSGTPSGATCVGQTLDQKQAADLIGRNGVFSFYGYAPSTFSATNSAISVSIAYYTAADSATPGTNTATSALSASGQAGGITGYTAVTAGPVAGTTGTLASGVETISLTTTPTRYAVYGPIPSANASGTAVTGAVVSICATPTAATTVSTDYFEITGAQLQEMPSVAGINTPNGIYGPTGFERRLAPVEATLQYGYTQPAGLGQEVATAYYMAGICKASGNANFPVTFNPPLARVPTTATSVITVGGYSIQTAAAVTAAGTLTIAGASTTGAVVNSTAACTTTLPYNLVGSATTGNILFSGEP